MLGLDVATDGAAIRERVGYMPEHDCLPPDVSATEFVVHMARMSGLPPTAARERTADTLRHVGLYEERYRPIGGYSTGMKQRVKLAQALVHDPQLVLLDEPTNGLDPAGRDDMLGLIRRIGTEFGISVLVTSHLLGELERVCDHVVVIDARPAAAVVVHRRRHRRQPADRRRGDRAHRRPGRAPSDRPGSASRPWARCSRSTCATTRRTTWCATPSSGSGVGLVRMERRRHRMAEIFTTPSATGRACRRPLSRALPPAGPARASSTTSATGTTTAPGWAAPPSPGALFVESARAPTGSAGRRARR